MHIIEFGKHVRHKFTGFEGFVIARKQSCYARDEYQVAGELMVNCAPVECQWFYDFELEETGSHVEIPECSFTSGLFAKKPRG